MAKPISVDFTGTEDSGFYVAPGTYTVKCTKVEQKEGPTAPYLEFSLKVEGTGTTLKNRCTLKPDGLFNLKNMLAALLGKEIPKAVIKIDPDKLVGRVCVATVADRTYDGKVYSDVTSVTAYVAPVRPSGTPTDDLDDL